MRSLRPFLELVCVVACLLCSHAAGAALPTAPTTASLPQPALLPHYSPLCDSNLVGCLDIDDFGAHAYAHLMLLPQTDQRDTALVIPYGISLGLWGRVAGGIATDFRFWQAGNVSVRQHGPLRLNLSLLLWPLLPFDQAPAMAQEEDGATHYQPAHHLRIGLHYEHQLRTGPFDGANALGLPTDLAALRLVASRAVGPVEITGSLGALYDWRGAFATGEAAIQLGVYLPFFRALKLYGEALVRGAPVYIRRAEDGTTPALSALLTPDGVDAINRQSVLGLGLSFRPQARVDLGVSVQKGTGGLAPTSVIVRAVVLSAGRTYQGRVATPITQLAADVTTEVAQYIHEYIKNLPVDPKLDERCMLLDVDNTPMMEDPVGTPTADGKHCMVQGEKLRIGEEWLRDRKKSVVCYDDKLQDCLLYRRPDAKGYRVLHRPWVGSDCVLHESVYDPSSPLTQSGQTHRTVDIAVVGVTTADKQGCRDQAGRIHNIGARYYREHGHRYICDAPRIEEQRDHCFMELAELPQLMQNQMTQLGRIARMLDRGASHKVEQIDKEPGRLVEKVQEVADGRITLRTMGDALKAKAINIAQHANTHDAKEWFKAKVADVKSWAGKPGIEQAEDVAESAGDALVPHPATVAATVLTGGLGRGALRIADEAADIGKLGKTVGQAAGKKTSRKVAKGVAEHVDESAARRLMKDLELQSTRAAAQTEAKHTRPLNMSPDGAGRRGAFREAKRQNGVPVSQTPSRVLPNVDRRGKRQPGRVYEYEVPAEGGRTHKVMIRDDAAGHYFGPGDPQNRSSHFNDAKEHHYDY